MAMSPSDDLADDDAAVVRQELARLESELLRVLGARRAALAAQGSPVFGRYLEIAAVAEVLGELMQQAIAADAERALTSCRETLGLLALYVDERPTSSPVRLH